MPERSYILPFNLNGYNHMQLEKYLSPLAYWRRNGKKKLLDIVTTEMKNKEAENSSERHPSFDKKRSRVEKFVDLGFLREILYASLNTQGHHSGNRPYLFYGCRTFVL